MLNHAPQQSTTPTTNDVNQIMVLGIMTHTPHHPMHSFIPGSSLHVDSLVVGQSEALVAIRAHRHPSGPASYILTRPSTGDVVAAALVLNLAIPQPSKVTNITEDVTANQAQPPAGRIGNPTQTQYFVTSCPDVERHRNQTS